MSKEEERDATCPLCGQAIHVKVDAEGRHTWTPREAAMPAVAKVAADAVARHEARYHGDDAA